MKDQVVMSKNNGELCVAIPLFRLHHQESLGKMEGCVVALMKSEPTAYVLEHPEFGLRLFNVDFIENNMEFLGELGDDEVDILPDPNSTHDIGIKPEPMPEMSEPNEEPMIIRNDKNNKGEDDGSSI